MKKKINSLYPQGHKYKDFVVQKSTEIHELQCTLTELIHLPTGAQIMHVGNDDSENLFCLSFQTFPASSNGVAHILEHTVLCGSKKFPVKDPFFAMTRRSLNTFMNALTGADFTCYPAATQEPKDFYNLLEVYLDAVFHPNLNELSFLQEGHRLEFAIPTDPNSPLEYKGIVFNEMKGALSSADSRLIEAMNEALFPDLTYGFNSGGDPKVIPKLTYEELIAFHKTFYHPSRCLFFFYGNLPPEQHLDFIAEHTLNQAEKLNPLPKLSPQKRFKAHKHLDLTYPISSEEDGQEQTILSFGWLTCNILELEELLALSILEIILLDTDASPLKRAILNSGVCKQVSSFMESDNFEIPCVIVLRGCQPESADKAENVIRTTLTEIVKNGIPSDLIENALHRLEFFRSEITGDHAPFGLTIFFRSGLLKQHGADPEHGLMIHSLFDELRQDIAQDPQYLTKLLQKYFLDNPHFVRIVMSPDKNLSAKEVADEKAELEEIRQKLTDDDICTIIKKAEELSEFQKLQEEEDPDILPKVTLDDVNKAARDFPLEKEKIGNLTLFHYETFTNEIVYADLVFNLPAVSEEDLPLVRLFSILLTQMGCDQRDYIQNLEYIQAHTGGVSAALSFNVQATDYNEFFPSFHIRGKALHRKAHFLFPLLHELAASPDFTDKIRLKEVIFKHYTGLQNSLNHSALKYAVNLSGSRINVPGKIINDWYGLNYFHTIKKLATDWDNQVEPLVKKLQQLKNDLLCLNEPHLIVTCDQEMYGKLKANKFYGLADIKTKAYKPWTGAYTLPSIVSQGRIIPANVAFLGKVFATIPYTHPDSAALNIASFLFDNVVLHKKIREQGGAYGGGAVANTVSGVFYFYSYRDPNIVLTLDAFAQSIKEIAEGLFDESDLEEAKLEMVQALDTPVSPGSRGELAYAWMREGKTHALRQKFRDKVLSLTKDEIIEAVKKHIEGGLEKGATVVFAGKELLEKENAHFLRKDKDPLHIENI